MFIPRLFLLLLFFFNDTATTEIYTLSLHDALPISCSSSICAGCPYRSTGINARVRGVIAASTLAGSMQYVSFSMSTNTGRAPTNSAAFAEATNVNGEVMISSPSPIPCPSMVRCRAAVPELTATACLTPHQAANSRSNDSTTGPCASWPLSRTSSTACFSSGPICGDATGIVFRVSKAASCYGLANRRGELGHGELGRMPVTEHLRSCAPRPEGPHLIRDLLGV